MDGRADGWSGGLTNGGMMARLWAQLFFSKPLEIANGETDETIVSSLIMYAYVYLTFISNCKKAKLII